jgi:hypothetical protein
MAEAVTGPDLSEEERLLHGRFNLGTEAVKCIGFILKILYF